MSQLEPQQTVVIDTPEGIEAFRCLQAYYALKLEVNTGLRHSRGSVAKMIKQRYLPHVTSNRKATILLEFGAYCREHGYLKDK